ncbi:MAG: hypothetical protein Q4E76_03505 [Tissierellia bacterium]|nr:hypothetical protein [Tissierellia bacterium]
MNGQWKPEDISREARAWLRAQGREVERALRGEEDLSPFREQRRAYLRGKLAERDVAAPERAEEAVRRAHDSRRGQRLLEAMLRQGSIEIVKGVLKLAAPRGGRGAGPIFPWNDSPQRRAQGDLAEAIEQSSQALRRARKK